VTFAELVRCDRFETRRVGILVRREDGQQHFSADCSRGFLRFASSGIGPMRQLEVPIVVTGRYARPAPCVAQYARKDFLPLTPAVFLSPGFVGRLDTPKTSL
jgi:hypothetical protein